MEPETACRADAMLSGLSLALGLTIRIDEEGLSIVQWSLALRFKKQADIRRSVFT